jgi:hypothetical protein
VVCFQERHIADKPVAFLRWKGRRVMIRGPTIQVFLIDFNLRLEMALSFGFLCFASLQRIIKYLNYVVISLVFQQQRHDGDYRSQAQMIRIDRW